MIKHLSILAVATIAVFTFFNNFTNPTFIKVQSEDTINFVNHPPFRAVQKNDHWALFKGTKQLTDFKYQYIHPMNKFGLSYVRVRHDSCGFINRVGKEVIPPHFYFYEYEEFNTSGAMLVFNYSTRSNHFIYTNGNIEKFSFNEDAALQKIMNPTSFPPSLKKYASLTDSIEFKERNCFRCTGITTWNTQTILSRALRAFVSEPNSYGLNKEIMASYGLPGGGGNYLTAITYSKGWETFKEKAVFEILKDEQKRKLVWPWLKENYKASYMLLHPNYRKEYKDIAISVKKYFGVNYNSQKAQLYLKNNSNSFAYQNPMNPNKSTTARKPAAFVERLVYVHKLMKIQDAQRWVNIVCNEVISWP
jgi:hypothetical protein